MTQTTTTGQGVSTAPPEPDPTRVPRRSRGPRMTGRRWALVLLSLGFYVAMLLQQPGKIFFDTKLNVAMAPGDWIARTFSLWVSGSDMGFVQNQAVGYLFPMASFFWVGDQVAPVWVVQRCWIATVLVVAFLGVVRLADDLAVAGPRIRVVIGLAYALSPFFVARAGNTTGLVLGGALLPWMLVPLVRASNGGSLRRGGLLSGVAVLAAGGINAAVTLTVLLSPLLWVLTRHRSRAQLVLAAWWALGVTLASTWWFLPLLFQSSYGVDFLPYTEPPEVTTGYASNVQILRGVADWLMYLNLGTPWIRSGFALVSDAVPIAATGAVAVLGVFGLTRRDLPHRVFLLLTLLTGATVMAAGYGGPFGNPFAGAFQDLLGGVGGPFRNIYKFQPLVLLPLALGFGHALHLITRRTPAKPLQGRRARRRHAIPAAGLLVVATLLVGAGAAPMWQGTITSAGGFEDIPGWWKQLAAWQRTLPSGERVLVVPNANNGAYVWGEPQDEPIDVLDSGPYVVRNLIPLGAPAETRVLDAIEMALTRGGDPALEPYLARAGISYVVARNDLDWSRWNSPRPAVVNAALTASGLEPVESFGPNLPLPGSDGRSAPVAGSTTELGGTEAGLRALEVYRVPSARGTVHSYPVAGAVGVEGSPEGVLPLIATGLAEDSAVILAGDATGRTPVGSWVATDSLQRTAFDSGLPNTNRSYALAADETAAAGGLEAGVNYLSYPSEELESVASFTGNLTGVTASSYGSWLYHLPEVRPSAAVDGDPATAWVTGSSGSAVGEWLELRFRAPVRVAELNLSLVEDGPWRPAVTALTLTTASGSRTVEVRPTEELQTVGVEPGMTDFVRVGFAALEGETPTSAGAGIREVLVPGVQGGSTLALSTRGPAVDPASYLFSRGTANFRDPLRDDPEARLDRSFSAAADGVGRVTGWGRPVPGAPLLELLERVQADFGGTGGTAPVALSASSTYGMLPDFRAANVLDGSPLTTWAPQPPTAASVVSAASGTDTLARGETSQIAPLPQSVDGDPSLTLSWDGPRTLDTLGIRLADGFSVPKAVELVSPEGTRRVELEPDGSLVPFPELTTQALTIRFVDVEARTLRTGLGTVTLPFGISELDVPALKDLTPVPLYPNSRVEVGCDDAPTAIVNETTTQFSISTTAADVIANRPVALQSCESSEVTLREGSNDLVSTSGNGTFNMSHLVVRPAGVSPAPSDLPVREVTVARWSGEDRQVDIAAGAATYLVVDENVNAGWVARYEGRELVAVPVDGWRQGYLVPAGGAGRVSLVFEPGTPYRAGLVVGLVLAALLLVLAALPARRRHPGILPGQASVLTAAVLALVISVVAGGALALAAPLAIWLALRRTGSRWFGHPSLVPGLAAMGMAGAAAVVTLDPGRLPYEAAGAFGPVAQVLASAAIVLIASSLVARNPEPAGRPPPAGP